MYHGPLIHGGTIPDPPDAPATPTGPSMTPEVDPLLADAPDSTRQLVAWMRGEAAGPPPPIRPWMNPGMDTAVLDLSGPTGHLRWWMTYYGAHAVRLRGSFDDLAFLVPCADLVTELRFIGEPKVGDLSALAEMRAVATLDSPPPAADALLPALPRLRRLTWLHEHDLAQLAACAALRELTLTLNPLRDLRALPELPALERLVLYLSKVRSLAGLERLTGLRSIGLKQVMPREEAGTEVLASRFGFTEVRRLVARNAAEARHAYKVDIELHADRAHALAAERTSTYAAHVTASRPACIVLLVDRSASAEQRFYIDRRVIARPEEPAHHITTHYGQGPDGKLPLARGITDAVNAFLRSLAARCVVNGELRHDVHVALVEYGARVGSAWGGALAGRDVVPIAEIAAHPMRRDAEGDAWLDVVHAGETPMGEALERAHLLVREWAAAHADSFPPVVVNLTAGKRTGDDLARHAWAIRSVATRDGAALLFTVVRDNGWGEPAWGVEGYSESEREPGFRLSSPLPPSIATAVRDAGYLLPDAPRGYLQDASAADFANALQLLVTLPGLPRDPAAIHHPLPPTAPNAFQLATGRWGVDDGLPRVVEWKPPKLRGPMSEELFWKVIDASRRGLEEQADQGDRLVRMLEQLDETAIVEWDRLLRTRLNEAYTWELWAVAFIANGGCSDDGFMYFRGWLVAQGRRYFEAALADPAKAAKAVQPGERAEFEDILGVASDAWRARTGRDDFHEHAAPVAPVEPRGEPWEEEELPRRYPKLAKRFGFVAEA